MAQRRMFSLTVVDTDNFLDMPQSTQSLYFHLGMRADDDGFVSSPRKIVKIVGAGNDDLKLLTTKGYIIPFESGVCVITDWNQNNLIQKDRYRETVYTNEKSALRKDKNGSYTLWIQNGSSLDPQYRLGKDSIAAMKEAEERAQAAEAKAQEAESAAVKAAKSTPKNDKQAKLNAEFWAKRDKLNR